MTVGAEPSRAGVVGRETWLALLVFTILAIVLAYPLSLHPAALRFPTGPDGDLGWYLLGWNTHAFLHKPWDIFEANIYYPMHRTLAYGENVIGIAIFSAPVIWLTGNLLLAANFASISSTILCGLGVYLLARRLGLSWMAALLAGIVFECAPPRFFRIAQINLSSVQWIPLALAALHGYFDDGKKWMLKAAAVCVTLEALSSGHGTVFMLVVLLVFMAYRLAMGEPLRIGQWTQDLGVVGVFILLPTFLVFLPYLEVQREVGLRRGLGSWGANYPSFLASPSHVHQFLIRHLVPWVNGNASSYLFPGIMVLLLAAAGVLAGRSVVRSERRSVPFPWLERAVMATVVVSTVAIAWPLLQCSAGGMRLHDALSSRPHWLFGAAIAAAGLVIRRSLPPELARWHRGPLLALLLAGVAWGTLVEARIRNVAGTGLSATYFTNAERQGDPVSAGLDLVPSTAAMEQRWNGSGPEIFSARWTGYVVVPRSANYRFALTSDDGSRMFVRYRPLIENGGAHGELTKSADIQLEAGAEQVTIEFEQYGAQAALNWQWSRDGGPLETVPSWVLSAQRVSPAAAQAARVIDTVAVPLAVVTLLGVLWSVRRAAFRREPIMLWRDTARRDPRLFYAVLALVTFGFALGPPYGLWQFVYALPGFSFIREPSRFMIVTLLCLSVLGAIGFDRVTRAASAAARMSLGFAIALFMVFEYAAMPMAVKPSNLDVPSIDRWLNTQPKPFVVAELPVYEVDALNAEDRQVDYMLHSTAHWQKTVHGYSGWRSELSRQLFHEMETFPDEVSLNHLSSLGVTHIVVHPQYYRGDWPQAAKRIEEYPERLQLLHTDDSGSVYLLKPLGR